MEKQISKVHRLALPLIVKRVGTSLLVSDGIFGHEFEFKDFGQIRVVGIDPEGFVTFEMSKPEQQTLIVSDSPRETIAFAGSFTHVSSSISKSSKSPDGIKGTYDYYKRATDDYFYAQHKIGTKTKKIYLGSLHDPKSDLHQIAIAAQRFQEAFDRKKIIPLLKKSQSHGQKLKAALDILVFEGYLERTEAQRSGKIHEEYKVTSKLRMLK